MCRGSDVLVWFLFCARVRGARSGSNHSSRGGDLCIFELFLVSRGEEIFFSVVRGSGRVSVMCVSSTVPSVPRDKREDREREDERPITKGWGPMHLAGEYQLGEERARREASDWSERAGKKSLY